MNDYSLTCWILLLICASLASIMFFLLVLADWHPNWLWSQKVEQMIRGFPNPCTPLIMATLSFVAAGYLLSISHNQPTVQTTVQPEDPKKQQIYDYIILVIMYINYIMCTFIPICEPEWMNLVDGSAAAFFLLASFLMAKFADFYSMMLVLLILLQRLIMNANPAFANANKSTWKQKLLLYFGLVTLEEHSQLRKEHYLLKEKQEQMEDYIGQLVSALQDGGIDVPSFPPMPSSSNNDQPSAQGSSSSYAKADEYKSIPKMQRTQKKKRFYGPK